MKLGPMPAAFSIDRKTGHIRIGDTVLLRAGDHRTTVEPQIIPWLDGSRDHGNGFAWLDLRGLTFGGQPAHLSLCFHGGLLEQASWSVRLPDAELQSGWPTCEVIETEIAFVHRTLASEMGIQAGAFVWGEIWSRFDPKGFLADNGVRYHRP